jgi:isoleucyl-tRNA synthetase
VALRTAVDQPRYAALITDELNLKSLHWLEDPTRVATVTAKANFRALGARFGKQTPQIAKAIAALDADALQALRREGEFRLGVKGQEVVLGPEDLFVQEEGLEGYVTESAQDCMLALDIRLDGALRQEGLARELVNRIQNLRKQAGLAVSDRITLYIGGDEVVSAALDAHRSHISEETLTVSLADSADGSAVREEFEIDGREVVIALTPTEA